VHDATVDILLSDISEKKSIAQATINKIQADRMEIFSGFMAPTDI
jgi:hypothetical protein